MSRTAGTPDLQHTGTPEVDLRRIAADLDHVRALGGLGEGRVRSLAIAAAVLRSLEDAQGRVRLVFHAGTLDRRHSSTPEDRR